MGACFVLSTGMLAAGAAPAVSLGVMGDSLSDEYAEESYGSYAQNWVEQLVIHAGVDAGPTAAAAGEPGGSRGEPRRTGYALDTVLPTGVKMVLVNVPDYGNTPTVRTFFPDPVARQDVADVIAQLNVGVDAIGQARQIPVLDLFGSGVAIFGPHASPKTTLLLGNVTIDLDQSDTAGGGNPTAGFVDDGIHPNTTIQGIFANVVLTALSIGYGSILPVFSEAEILAHRGLAYGGADTLTAALGNYSDYVANYAPSPAVVPALSPLGIAVTGLLLAGAALFALPMRRVLQM
ncbi:MAG: hypothetical protein ACE5FL_11595 [Myxococcota bacterium]